MHVKVTVTVRGRPVPLDQVKDARISAPFEAMAREVAASLEALQCPEHGLKATNVRIHVDARGAADLKYESCCPTLADLISKSLG